MIKQSLLFKACKRANSISFSTQNAHGHSIIDTTPASYESGSRAQFNVGRAFVSLRKVTDGDSNPHQGLIPSSMCTTAPIYL